MSVGENEDGQIPSYRPAGGELELMDRTDAKRTGGGEIQKKEITLCGKKFAVCKGALSKENRKSPTLPGIGSAVANKCQSIVAEMWEKNPFGGRCRPN